MISEGFYSTESSTFPMDYTGKKKRHNNTGFTKSCSMNVLTFCSIVKKLVIYLVLKKGKIGFSDFLSNGKN